MDLRPAFRHIKGALSPRGLAVLALAALGAVASAADFFILLPNGFRPIDVSADGQVVVGSMVVGGVQFPARWNSSGVVQLSTQPGACIGVSGDNNIFLIYEAGGLFGVKKGTGPGGFIPLAGPAGFVPQASALSYIGDMVAGSLVNGGGIPSLGWWPDITQPGLVAGPAGVAGTVGDFALNNVLGAGKDGAGDDLAMKFRRNGNNFVLSPPSEAGRH